MIYKLSQNIAYYFVKKKMIKESDQDLYRFGIETILCSCIDVAIIISVGAFFKRIYEILWFYTVFCYLRRNIEGYHAKTCLACKIIMTFMLVTVLYYGTILEKYIDIQLVVVSGIAVVILIEGRVIKDKKLCIILSYFVLEIILIHFNSYLAAITMMCYFIVLTVAKRKKVKIL
ncbi:MAG: accessory gene regulator B family protein [Lachnospiraceae bacterium]